jgi:hypothetical protein
VTAGALSAAAIATVLHGFAAAIGLAVASTAPTWRDSSLALVLLSGFYLIVVALAAYGAGGYVAGRLRAPLLAAQGDEVEFRDGAHGLASWALATLLAATIAFATAMGAAQLAAPSGGDAGAASSVGGEAMIAYDVDRLLRSSQERAADYEFARAEAGRILLTASSHSGVTSDDRAYLAQLTARQTGISEADAEARVSAAIASVDDNIASARQSSVVIAFAAAAAALLGAAAAWFGAVLGGNHRDAPVSARWGWAGPRPRPVAGTAGRRPG